MMLWSQIPIHKISVILFWEKWKKEKEKKETLCEACLQPCPWFTSFISEGISKLASYWESAHNFTHKGHQVIHTMSSDFSWCTSCAVFLRVGDRRTTPVYATVNARRPIIMYNHFSDPFPVWTIAVCENKQAVSSCQQTTNKKFFGTRTCGPWQNARANRDTNTANPLLGNIPPSSRPRETIRQKMAATATFRLPDGLLSLAPRSFVGVLHTVLVRSEKLQPKWSRYGIHYAVTFATSTIDRLDSTRGGAWQSPQENSVLPPDGGSA